MSFIPFSHRTLFLQPFQASGQTASGIEIIHHRLLPVIYGRVTQVHPTCRYVRVGDWIIFEVGRPERLTTDSGSIYSLSETQVLGIVEPGDGGVWFEED